VHFYAFTTEELKMKILVTGASRNIGLVLIKSLSKMDEQIDIIAGGFDVEKSKKKLSAFKNLSFRHVDFSRPTTFSEALEGIDILFLLRPPQLADVEKYFRPFLTKAKEMKIGKIMFLSVQDIENQKFIPHHKLEKLILKLDFKYIFLCPGYLMQNLTTTLL